MEKNLFTFNSKTIPKAFLGSIVLVLCVFFIELVILPINLFTFRTWEAISVNKLGIILSGPFYPNRECEMLEKGDLGHRTKYAEKKLCKWATDQYGYRKSNSSNSNPEIVIIGDSFAAGSGLTQDDILSEILEGMLDMGVYSLAPADVNTFFNDKRFLKKPPKIVIFEIIERSIQHLPNVRKIHKSTFSIWKYKFKEILRTKFQNIMVLLDRSTKNIIPKYFISRMKAQKVLCYYKAKTHDPMLFFQGLAANKDVPEEKLKNVVEIIKSYNKAFKKIGSRFIFLPIPNKENTYCDYLPVKAKPMFLKTLISELEKDGIEVIDTQSLFDYEYNRNNVMLYHNDDTHWNAKGVKVTAELIKEQIMSEE